MTNLLQENSKFLWLSLLTIILITSCIIAFSELSAVSKKEINLSSSEGKSKLELIVREYVKSARQGDFVKLEILVSYPQKGYGLSNEKLPNTSEYAVKVPIARFEPSEEIFQKQNYKWVTKEFPEFIDDQKLVIKGVMEESAIGDKARIVVFLELEEGGGIFPWAFLMHKTNETEDWKIFDIKTPGWAANFPPAK